MKVGKDLENDVERASVIRDVIGWENILVCCVIVNRADGQKASHQFNRTYYLCYCSGLCKYVHLCHHVAILYLRKQPIRVTDLDHSPVRLNNTYVLLRSLLADGS